MALTGSITLNFNAIETPAAGVSEIISAPAVVNKSYQWSWSSGVAINQADKIFADQRTLTTGATEDLDLAGVLAPLFGATLLTFVKLKAFVLFNLITNTTNITVSRPAGSTGVPIFAAVSDALAAIKPGGCFAWWDPSLAGVAVTAGTGDLITITNSAGASCVYDVIIVGTSS